MNDNLDGIRSDIWGIRAQLVDLKGQISIGIVGLWVLAGIILWRVW